MGLYIRKGFNFGPLRLNLSRSGLGASFGVKGARIGIGPRGRYVHLGRGGLYYRHSLEQSPRVRRPQQQFPPQTASHGLQEITSASAQTIVDSSAEDLLKELNRVQSRWDLCPMVTIAGGLCILFVIPLSMIWAVLVAMLVVPLAVLARHYDVLQGTVVLQYLLEDDASKIFADLSNTFMRGGACKAIWHLDAQGRTNDWKRNSGVSTLVQRSGTKVEFSPPKKIQCNLKVPSLRAGRKTLYFFPDRLLIYDKSGVGAVSYAHLQAESVQTGFVETDQVPSDAQQVGTTWRFVNKKGGPDRRFNNNRQLPVVAYGELFLTSESGVKELFQFSVPTNASAVASAICAMAPRTMSATR